ncbi:MAG: flavin reductase family protein [Gammaproteobacteria bacterium]|nr:MAG: flavin reductase family protein [Gammaproteobacteria bacterium]UCH38651.1 MAG: flavin reductase family protein [Gammaproteobacteria bacterium]
MQIKLEQLPTPQVYFTMTQTLLPRPIAWLLSENDDASYNLAPFSYFNAVCSDPPLAIVSIGKQDDGRDKDSIRNIRERHEFVIHIASCDQLAALNQSSATLPPGESEVDASNLELTRVKGLRMPRLSDCKIALFCERHDIQMIGRKKQQSLLFAEIKEIYLDDSCAEITEQGRLKVHTDKVQPLSRLGASEYASFGEVLFAKRPD